MTDIVESGAAGLAALVLGIGVSLSTLEASLLAVSVARAV
jgi:hypothetical protein